MWFIHIFIKYIYIYIFSEKPSSFYKNLFVGLFSSCLTYVVYSYLKKVWNYILRKNLLVSENYILFFWGCIFKVHESMSILQKNPIISRNYIELFLGAFLQRSKTLSRRRRRAQRALLFVSSWRCLPPWEW